eukprot:g22459.t1
MAGRARRPWLSVVMGLVLGFIAASWLIVPRAVETNGRNKKIFNICSSLLNRAGVGRAGAGAAAGGGSSSNSRSLGWHRDQLLVSKLPKGQQSQEEEEEEEEEAEEAARASGKHFLYVGVMTAKKYLDSRAVAAYRSWAPSIPGKVEFFSSQGSQSIALPVPLPLVSLPGVDDSYPPQKKSFMMLKYMHDRYLDGFEWFMRADDDVYIKGERLEELLRSLNSSQPLYLGQTGLGTTEELGKLALEPGENFCMGGPGMIFSREVLRRMVPHIGECLREMYTSHEDVEIGRCVRRFANTQCVWSYE